MSPVIRIALRYIAGFLIAKGLADADLANDITDPDLVASIEAGIGLAIAAISEVWYARAKTKGGAT